MISIDNVRQNAVRPRTVPAMTYNAFSLTAIDLATRVLHTVIPLSGDDLTRSHHERAVVNRVEGKEQTTTRYYMPALSAILCPYVVRLCVRPVLLWRSADEIDALSVRVYLKCIDEFHASKSMRAAAFVERTSEQLQLHTHTHTHVLRTHTIYVQ